MQSSILLLPFLFASVFAVCEDVEQDDPIFGKRSAVYCDAHKKTYTTEKLANAAVVAEATTHWTANGGIELSAINNVEILFSFGSNDSPTDTQRTGFVRVLNLIKKMTEKTTIHNAMGPGVGTDTRFYLDAIVLTKVRGAYWKPNLSGYATADLLTKPVGEGGSFPLNIYWDKYYKKAMEKATYMVWMLTDGWYNSPNCGEELDWASGTEGFNRKAATKKNFACLLDDKAVAEFPKTTDLTNSKATKAKWDLIGVNTASAGTIATKLSMADDNFNTILEKIIVALGLPRKATLLELSSASKHKKNETTTTTTGFLEAQAHFKKKL